MERQSRDFDPSEPVTPSLRLLGSRALLVTPNKERRIG